MTAAISAIAEPLESRFLLSALSPSQASASDNTATPTFIDLGPISNSVKPAENSLPLVAPFTPSEIVQAYGVNLISFDGTAGIGTGQTIAIVDAYNDPDIIADANSFSASFDLPQFNSSGGPTLTVLNQTGGTALPSDAAPGTWDLEESLDVEWAHVVAPDANIILFEANSNTNTDMYQAVETAADYAGVSVVSMSWGESESAGEQGDDAIFTTPIGHQGVTFLASSGDYGGFASYPAMSPNVISVGGTTLSINSDGSYLSESAWTDGGGGFSAYEPQPLYQSGKVNNTSTTNRTGPDVSMDADPYTGVFVLDTYYSSSYQQVGGTSLACPLWAGLISIVSQGLSIQGLGSLDGPTQTLPDLYNLPSFDFHDITTGSNGYPATVGYDLATGLGTPIANLLVPALAGNSTVPSLAFSPEPSGYTTAGNSLSPIVVDIDNRDGTLDSSDNSAVTLSIYSGPAGAALEGAATVDAVNGVATFNNISITTAGSYTLKATDPYHVLALSGNFEIVAAAPAQLVFLQEPTGSTTLGTISTFEVAIEDQYSNIVTDNDSLVNISIATGPAGAALSGTDSVNAVDGVATFSDVNLTVDGSYTLEASSGMMTAVSSPFFVGQQAFELTELAAFDGIDGQRPVNGVVEDSSGNLYGTTDNGGAYGFGVIYEIVHGTDALVTLASFDSSNGASPECQLVMDGAGDLYGTTLDGGSASHGTIFELVKGSGTITTLYSFLGGSDGGDPQAGVVVDSSGNLYGTTDLNGANGYGTIFELAKGATSVTTLVSFGGEDGAYPAAGLIMDSSGNFYGTTSGGAAGYGTVFEFVRSSSTLKTLVALQATSGDPLGDLLMDSNGNLYGTTSFLDGSVFEIPKSTGQLKTLAYFYGDNGALPQGNLVMDDDGDLFGTTEGPGDGTLFEIVASTDSLNTLVNFNGIDGSNPAGDLIMNSAGDILGTTINGGSGGGAGAGVVYELHPIHLAFLQSPISQVAGATMNPAVTVAVEDSGGNVLAGDDSTITISIASGPSGAVLGGTLSQSTVDGVASFNNLSLVTDRTYSLEAADTTYSSVTSIISPSFSVTGSSTPAALEFVQQPTTTYRGTTNAPVSVDVVNSFGNVVTTDNSMVSIAIESGPPYSVLGGTTTVQAVDGVATFSTLALYSPPGAFTLEATDGSLAPAYSAKFLIIGDAAQLAFAQQPTNSSDQTPISPAVTVDVEDGVGNVATYYNSSIFLSIASGPPGGSFNGQKSASANAVNGVVTFTDLFLSEPGTYVLEATDNELLGATSRSFVITAGSYDDSVLNNLTLSDSFSPQGGLLMDSNGNLYGVCEGGSAGNGILFEIAAGANTLTMLAQFSDSGSAGYMPMGNIAMDSNGNIYGATEMGGPDDFGTIFEWDKSSDTLTTLASFNNSTGQNPSAGVVMDGHGTLYVLLSRGVDELVNGSTQILPLVNFAGDEFAGVVVGGRLMIDGNGNIFGMEELGGYDEMGTIFEISGSSIAENDPRLTTLAIFSGANGSDPEGALIEDSSGNLYGTTSQGGAYGLGTVFELPAGSDTIQTLVSFNAIDGNDPQAGLVMDRQGDLFGTTMDGIYESGTVFELPKGSGTITTLLAFDGTNGANPMEELLIDGHGNFYGRAEAGGSDGDGVVFELSPIATVNGAYVFYYGSSAFDNGDTLPSAEDQNAIATNKSPLSPGQAAIFANVSSYIDGINGILIDFGDEPAGTTFSAGDFQFNVGNNSTPSSWGLAPVPTAVATWIGNNGDTFADIVWANGAIRDQWLQVTIQASANTHLALPDVFYFGSLVGATGASFTSTSNGSLLQVTSADVEQTELNLSEQSTVPITSSYDFDRNGQVTSTDVEFAELNLTEQSGLELIDLGSSGLVVSSLKSKGNSTQTAAAAVPSAPPTPTTVLSNSAIDDSSSTTPSVLRQNSDVLARLVRHYRE